jgi:hypothetical protein
MGKVCLEMDGRFASLVGVKDNENKVIAVAPPKVSRSWRNVHGIGGGGEITSSKY